MDLGAQSQRSCWQRRQLGVYRDRVRSQRYIVGHVGHSVLKKAGSSLES